MGVRVLALVRARRLRCPRHRFALSLSRLSGPSFYRLTHRHHMGWIVVLGFLAALIILPILPWMLQRRGVAWTYKAGFPVAAYWRDDMPNTELSDGLLAEEKDGAVLVREQNPVELFKWPAGLVGRIERVDQRARLTFVTDWHTTVVWLANGFYGVAGLSLPFIAPEMWDPSTSWGERISLFGMSAVLVGLCVGIFLWMRKRARTKSDRFANALDFV